MVGGEGEKAEKRVTIGDGGGGGEGDKAEKRVTIGEGGGR